MSCGSGAQRPGAYDWAESLQVPCSAFGGAATAYSRVPYRIAKSKSDVPHVGLHSDKLARSPLVARRVLDLRAIGESPLHDF
jgi:hypothetical protein